MSSSVTQGDEMHSSDLWVSMPGKFKHGAFFVTLTIGYLLGIISAKNLTFINVAIFTVLNVLAILSYLYLSILQQRRSRLAWVVLFLMGVFAFAAGMLTHFGVGFDWLFYIVAVGIYFSVLPISIATCGTIGLYLLLGANLLYIDGWNSFVFDWLSLLAAIGFVIVFSLLTRNALTQRLCMEKLLQQLATANRELGEAHVQLQRYAKEVEELAIERERTRVAREIHDTLGHYLTILNLQLETTSKLFERDPQRAMQEVLEARRVAAQSIQEVRNAVAALRPTNVETLNLKEVLAVLKDEFQRVTPQTEVVLDLDTSLPSLLADVRHTMYRVAQEALTNVRKHAKASKVLIRLRYEQEQLTLLVLDNGPSQQSIDKKEEQKTGGGFGLIGLRERIELLGGQVSYGPADTGYRVLASVPVVATGDE